MAAVLRSRLRDALPASLLIEGAFSRSLLSNGTNTFYTKGVGFIVTTNENLAAIPEDVDVNKEACYSGPEKVGVPATSESTQVRCGPAFRPDFSTSNVFQSTHALAECSQFKSCIGPSVRRRPWRELTQSLVTAEGMRALHTSRGPWSVQQLPANQKHDRQAREKGSMTGTHRELRIPRSEQLQTPVSPNVVNVSGQPPPSQPLDGDLLPRSPEEEKIALVLARPDLLITRNVEWANLAFGFEQQNKYVIMDPRQPQAPVGYIVEDSNFLLRQVLRTKRPFTASVLDANGEEVCRVRRPIYFIRSSIYVEINGKVVGECHRRWHLWRRLYDVYLGDKQFAAVENPGFWYWTFTLKDENGGVLAEIDRNWRGFGFEFLTDAGQYVVRFGDVLPKGSTSYNTSTSEQDRKPLLSSSNEKTGAEEMHQLQEAAEQAEALAVIRPLTLIERAVALALAVSLDNDYFSRHSQAGVGMPLPIPFFGAGATAEDTSSETESGQSGTAGMSHPGAVSGYEVFPEEGSEGPYTTGDQANPSFGNYDKFADDPYRDMFDDQEPGDQNSDHLFDDPEPPAESGGGWGLDNWGDFGDFDRGE